MNDWMMDFGHQQPCMFLSCTSASKGQASVNGRRMSVLINTLTWPSNLRHTRNGAQRSLSSDNILGLVVGTCIQVIRNHKHCFRSEHETKKAYLSLLFFLFLLTSHLLPTSLVIIVRCTYPWKGTVERAAHCSDRINYG